METYEKLIRGSDESEKIIPKIINLDELYSRTPNTKLISDVSLSNNYMDNISKLVVDVRNDVVDAVCSCDCEYSDLKGEIYLNTICPNCGTVIKSSLVENLTNEVWIEVPPSIKAFIHPRIFNILSLALKKGKSVKNSYIYDILDPAANLETLAPHIQGQGFNYFYDNFDYIINFFTNIFPPTKNRSSVKYLPLFLEKHRSFIFCNYLPILSKYLHTVTKSGYSLMSADPNLKNLFSAINKAILQKLTYKVLSSSRSINKSTWNIYSAYNKYYSEIIDSKFKAKKGYYRKNVFGSRVHFSARSVAVPIIERCQADEIHLNWKSSLSLFKYHIINILNKRIGFSTMEALEKIRNAYYCYDPIIDQIFQLLIIESKFKGIPVLINRNPSIRISNIALNFVTKITANIVPISEKFLALYGNGNYKLHKYSYTTKDLYTSTNRVVEFNNFDTLEFIKYYKSKSYTFNLNTIKITIDDFTIEELRNNLKTIIIADIPNSVDTVMNLDPNSLEFKLKKIKTNGENYIPTKQDLQFVENSISNINANFTREISDATFHVSYLTVGLFNLDFDGDSVNLFAGLFENKIVDHMIDRNHPSAFFLINDMPEISSRINLPSEHLILLNGFLEDQD